MEDYINAGFSAHVSTKRIIVVGRIHSQDGAIFHRTTADMLDCCDRVPKGGRMNIFLYFDYVNTWASKHLMDVFRNLDKLAATKGVEIDVRWAFLEDDADLLELGQIYSEEMKRVNFRFHALEAQLAG